jgi:NADH dehydrogenase subunit B (EC 1.6.5.3)
MHWTLTKAETDPAPQSGQQTYEEALRRNFLFAKLEDMVAWGQSNSVWPFNFGLSCCYVEMATAFTSRHDIARFGSEVIRGSPRQADLIVISGDGVPKNGPGGQTALRSTAGTALGHIHGFLRQLRRYV